ncbi:hypothetical protein [Ochrobactrum sp. BTU1]|uniref:hypothetical protein n=1 Tax=Ochrobactrum sp. BTU1 TaxID=2840456 RepID=UPI001C05CA2B|nr:hypothetical protein KMS41_17445 [Ochrobactrum sp. BTU1]
MQTLLRTETLKKSFGSIAIHRNGQTDLRIGSVQVGGNCVGKSVFLSILIGVERDGAKISLRGEEVQGPTSTEALQPGIEIRAGAEFCSTKALCEEIFSVANLLIDGGYTLH